MSAPTLREAAQHALYALTTPMQSPADRQAAIAGLRAAMAQPDEPLTTRGQQMRDAGYTRRPSAKALPSDGDEVQPL